LSAGVVPSIQTGAARAGDARIARVPGTPKIPSRSNVNASAHPPKVEIFDVAAGINIDNKGLERRVDVYREEPFGLYMSREVVEHPTSFWIESYLLPDLGIRVSKWKWKPGEPAEHDYYIDIVTIEHDGALWRVTDYYLDIIVARGSRPELVDIDELTLALHEGLIDPKEAERALRTSHAAMAGLAENGYSMDAWLRTYGITLVWPAR